MSSEGTAPIQTQEVLRIVAFGGSLLLLEVVWLVLVVPYLNEQIDPTFSLMKVLIAVVKPLSAPLVGDLLAVAVVFATALLAAIAGRKAGPVLLILVFAICAVLWLQYLYLDAFLTPEFGG